MLRSWLAWLLLAGVPAASAWETVAGGVVLRCRQPDWQVVQCDFRPSAGGQPDIALRAGTGEVPVSERTPFPWPQAKSAWLLLVDTSDPARANVVEQNVRQIARIVAAMRPHHRIGLARFDKDLELLAPMGSTADAVTGAAQRLRATGMTTELYRNLLRAVEMLAATAADRRFIVMFSDGQAEDTAYFHEDVVKAARAGGVSIMSLGFPRSVARSVALQSLQRLSEDTGGLYLESDPGGTLAEGFEQRLIAGADGGGRIAFSLPKPENLTATATLVLRSGGGETRVDMPLELPPSAAPARIAAPETRLPSPVRAPTPAAAPLPLRSTEPWLWYGVPAALIVLIVLALTTLYLLSRQPRKGRDIPHPVVPELKPFAYLISQTSHPKRYAISGAIWRIGRSRENELVLDDVSVSRRHAEIQRGPDGAFTVLDRGSRNGIFVNGQQVRKKVLQEGDLIEIGDVVLRFTESGADEQLQEPTAVQHTRQPGIA